MHDRGGAADDVGGELSMRAGGASDRAGGREFARHDDPGEYVLHGGGVGGDAEDAALPLRVDGKIWGVFRCTAMGRGCWGSGRFGYWRR